MRIRTNVGQVEIAGDILNHKRRDRQPVYEHFPRGLTRRAIMRISSTKHTVSLRRRHQANFSLAISVLRTRAPPKIPIPSLLLPPISRPWLANRTRMDSVEALIQAAKHLYVLPAPSGCCNELKIQSDLFVASTTVKVFYAAILWSPSETEPWASMW